MFEQEVIQVSTMKIEDQKLIEEFRNMNLGEKNP